jgi:uncharacterized damage-inducible protein DinB
VVRCLGPAPDAPKRSRIAETPVRICRRLRAGADWDAQYSVVVRDQKPPRLAVGEAETLHALLQFQRESLVRKVADLDDAAARQSPVASGTTLLWLIKHMARVEITWVLHRFAGHDVVIPVGEPEPGDTLAAAASSYRQAWRRVDAVAFAEASLDELCRLPEADRPVSLRWVLMHLLEETARHAGHADILRELIDGQTGR